jgi:hypothetical protein
VSLRVEIVSSVLKLALTFVPARSTLCHWARKSVNGQFSTCRSTDLQSLAASRSVAVGEIAVIVEPAGITTSENVALLAQQTASLPVVVAVQTTVSGFRL